MRVISKSRLKQFWETQGNTDAEVPLRAWYTHVRSRTVSWRSWGDVASTYRSASLVGNCVVFNIGGNKYRLVTRVLYQSRKIFVLKIMTHAEYDEDRWKQQCGCFEPAPRRTPKPYRGDGQGGQRRH
jgi:mRNA interferase HigB